MKTKYLFLLFSILITLNSCKKDEIANPDNYSLPDIEFALQEQPADLNKIDNLPAVGVITSELGLKSVKLSLVVGEEVKLYKEITEFFNYKSYSFAEKFDYTSNYKDLIVEAVDLAGRSVSATLHFQITEFREPPMIVFDPPKISFDEQDPNAIPIPNTKFSITTTAGLKRLELTLITKTEQVEWGFPVDFNDAPLLYEFDSFVDYKEGDIGFRVKATDIYGQIKITTLPIEYITAPPPVLELESDVYVKEIGNITIPMKIQAVGGVKKIDFYKIEKGQETIISSIDYNGENDLNILPSVLFSSSMDALKIIVFDNLGKETAKTVKTIVGLKYLENYVVGSHRYAAGLSELPGVYSLFSIKDMEAYSIGEILGNTENNVDIKFYMFGGGGVPRVYPIDGGTGTKSNEFVGKNGTVVNFNTANATRFLKLPANFDFDRATVDDIQAISPSLITSNNINPANPGDIIAFKTAASSTAGGNKVGLMKIMKVEHTSTNIKDQGTFTISIKFLDN